jgi:signal peptidase I
MTPARPVLLSILAILASIRAASPLTTTIVLGHSMEPTLHSGQFAALDRSYYRSHSLADGDVVVLRVQGETYIKRVAALPGEQLWLLQYDDGIGSQVVDEAQAARLRRLYPPGNTCGCAVERLTILPGRCFVLGDNSEVSEDSRDFGPVPISAIVGRAVL